MRFEKSYEAEHPRLRREIRKGHRRLMLPTPPMTANFRGRQQRSLASRAKTALRSSSAAHDTSNRNNGETASLAASERSCTQARRKVLSRRGGRRHGAGWMEGGPCNVLACSSPIAPPPILRHSCQAGPWKANTYPLPRCNEMQFGIYLSLTIIRAIFRGNHLHTQGSYFVLEFHFN